MSDSDSQKFIIDFFNNFSQILEKKKGGKRKNKYIKRQKGSGKDGELDLPVPLNDKNIFDVQQLQKKLQNKNVSIELLPSNSIPDSEINSEFSIHIKNILDNITTKPAIEMTPEELQVLSLFINFKKMLPEVKAASEITSQPLKEIMKTDNIIVDDDSSNENIQMVSKLINAVPGPDNLTEKQIQILETITNNTVNEVTNLSQLYISTASPQEISSASTSTFLNLFGHLSFLFSILACYRNRANNFSLNLKQQNPIIYFIMSSIFYCISFVLFVIFKIFTILINTKVGKIYLTFVFLKLYKENNAIAVFIANIIIKIAGLIDQEFGISSYVMTCVETIKQYVISNIPNLLNNSSINALLTTAIGTVLSSPSFLANFINSLSPELSSQIIQQSMPIISQSLSNAMTQASPQFIQLLTEGVTQGVTEGVTQSLAPQIVGAISEGTMTIVSELAPTLIEGISTSVTSNIGTMITDVTISSITQANAQVAQQQITSNVINSFTKTALGYGIQYVSYYLTGDTSIGENMSNVLTNSGGKNSIKIHKNKNKKNKKNSKTIKANKSKKLKRRMNHSKTHKYK